MAALPWWADAVVYQVYLRSFADGDGDGVGDLNGLRRRLDHLADLGVDAVWLNPCYPSPQRDHGYDVADYFDIDPVYGSLAEFDVLVADASARGIRVLMDVVPNHCSDQHPWFQAALAAGRGAAERLRFFVRDGQGDNGELPPNNWRSLFGGPAWHRITEPDGSPGQWYLALFAAEQPDFDWSDPAVAAMFDRMLTFWFDRGVAGMRADAITLTGKHPQLPDWDGQDAAVEIGAINPHHFHRPEGHAAWRGWRALIDRMPDAAGAERLLIAEAHCPGRPDLLSSYVNDGEFHQAFAFELMMAPWNALDIAGAVAFHLEHVRARGHWPAWTVNNHDAQRAVTRYGRPDATTVYPGNTLFCAPNEVDVALGTRRVRAMTVLQMALPGSVYLYAGEELGLPEVLDLPAAARRDPMYLNTAGRSLGRDGCRVPLPWTADPTGSHGFSIAPDSAPPWLPQPAEWRRLAVDTQLSDPDSVLQLYRSAISARRDARAVVSVDGELVVHDQGVVEIRRDGLRCLLNCTDVAAVVPGLAGDETVALSSLKHHADPTVVPGDAAIWLRRGGSSRATGDLG